MDALCARAGLRREECVRLLQGAGAWSEGAAAAAAALAVPPAFGSASRLRMGAADALAAAPAPAEAGAAVEELAEVRGEGQQQEPVEAQLQMGAGACSRTRAALHFDLCAEELDAAEREFVPDVQPVHRHVADVGWLPRKLPRAMDAPRGAPGCMVPFSEAAARAVFEPRGRAECLKLLQDAGQFGRDLQAAALLEPQRGSCLPYGSGCMQGRCMERRCRCAQHWCGGSCAQRLAAFGDRCQEGA